jgi:hypothetical protein
MPIVKLSNRRWPIAAGHGIDLSGLIDERVPGVAVSTISLKDLNTRFKSQFCRMNGQDVFRTVEFGRAWRRRRSRPSYTYQGDDQCGGRAHAVVRRRLHEFLIGRFAVSQELDLRKAQGAITIAGNASRPCCLQERVRRGLMRPAISCLWCFSGAGWRINSEDCLIF